MDKGTTEQLVKAIEKTEGGSIIKGPKLDSNAIKFRNLVMANIKSGKSREASLFDAGKTWLADGHSLNDILSITYEQLEVPSNNLDLWLALQNCQYPAHRVMKDCLSKNKDKCIFAYELLKECMNVVVSPKEKQDLDTCIEKGLVVVLEIMSKTSEEEFKSKGDEYWNSLLRQHQDCSAEREKLRSNSKITWDTLFPKQAAEKYQSLAKSLKKCSKQSTALHICTEKGETCVAESQQLLACATTSLNLRPGSSLVTCLEARKQDCTEEHVNAMKALNEYKNELLASLGMPDDLNGAQRSEVLQVISSVLDPVVLATTRLAQMGVKHAAKH